MHLFDTHCHLNFKSFSSDIESVVQRAKDVGVTHIMVPGTDVATSEKAVRIAEQYEGVYAAIGVHPHHVYELTGPVSHNSSYLSVQKLIHLLSHQKVLAIGEVGLDRHEYKKTKYEKYHITDSFMHSQKELLTAQIQLAINHDKSLILHNREAKADMLTLLSEHWDSKLEGRSVFHCCEPDTDILAFAKEHKMYIGVDGDVTYSREKQEFIKTVPLEMLVLETDAPYLTPEPLRSKSPRPANEPKNIPLIAEYVARLKNVPMSRLIETIEENSRKLFGLSSEK